MTDEPTLPQDTPEPTPDPPPGEPRRLTRSTADRMLGGVAGGLGRYFAVDPVLFRIGFVVLALAGGSGILAYLLLLIVVPSDGGEADRSSTRIVLIAGAALLALIVIGPGWWFFGPGTLWLVALAGLGALLWYVSRGEGGDPTVRGRLTRVLLVAFVGMLALTLGVAGALGAALGGGAIVAGIVIACGVGLVAAAFAGGARWLIVPALLLAAPLAVVAAADVELDGGIGEREYRPTTIADVRPFYEVGIGRLELDLREVDFPAGRTELKVDVGIGAVDIAVPPDVCVSSDVNVGAGYAEVLDRGEDGGFDVAFASDRSPRPGAPRLHIEGDVGLGALFVDDGLGGHFGRRFDGPFGRFDDDEGLDPISNQACTARGA